MNNSNIIITERDNILLVDSRLIAEKLGIKHPSFVALIKKHQVKLEASFGSVRFEIVSKTSLHRNPKPEQFAWLTEGQATFLMTLSRNTAKVVDLKIDLVKAFETAKVSKQPIEQNRPNLNTFTIYDLKPWQIERILVAIGYRENDELIPAAYLEGMEDFDLPIWEIPFDVINWLQSLHQDLIEEFTYRKCLESNNLSSNKVLQDYVREFEANAAIRDYSEIRNMAELIAPFEKIEIVEKELATLESSMKLF